MALVIKDRVRETSTTVGTGNLALAGAVTGYQSFVSAIGNGNTTYYAIYNPGTVEWEVGLGTMSAGALVRTTVYASSNSGSLVNFSAGNKDVFGTYPAEKAAYTDTSGQLIAPGLAADGVLYTSSTGVVTSGTSLTYDGSKFGVNSATPAVTTELVGTDAVLVPAGTTAERPAGVAGYLRFNSTSSEFEGYNGTGWASVGGAALSNDTSTATALYPIFANATSGTASTIYTSNANLLYTPSTGEFVAKEVVASNGLVVNNMTVGSNYSIPSGYSASSVGPVTVSGGVSVTVPSGSRWVVL